MLFADHVQPDPVWYQLDPGEGDGKMVVVVPDASTEDLENFVRKLYRPGAEVFYNAVPSPNTPDIVPGSPDTRYLPHCCSSDSTPASITTSGQC